MRVRPAPGKAAWTPAPAALLLLLAILVTVGCDQVLTNAQLPPVREDAILGQWKDLGVPGSNPEPDLLLVRFEEGQYRIGTSADFAKDKATRFTLARVGNVLIAQSPGESQCEDEFHGQKDKPCWTLSRVEILRDRMSWYDFDAARLVRESVLGNLNVPHSVHRQRNSDGTVDNAVLISADAAGLERFLESRVKQRALFRLSGRLQRVP